MMEQMAIAMWIKFDAVKGTSPLEPGSHSSLISRNIYSDTGSVHFNISKIEDSVLFEFTLNGTPECEILSESSLTAGTWYHVVLTYDNTKDVGNIYINSQLDNTVNGTAGPALIGNAAIGDWTGAFYETDRHFDGTMDDIRIYNYAVSQEEVAAIYAGKDLGKPRNWIPVLIIFLVAVVAVFLVTRRKKTTI
jgi:hypothetical protein